MLKREAWEINQFGRIVSDAALNIIVTLLASFTMLAVIRLNRTNPYLLELSRSLGSTLPKCMAAITSAITGGPIVGQRDDCGLLVSEEMLFDHQAWRTDTTSAWLPRIHLGAGPRFPEYI